MRNNTSMTIKKHLERFSLNELDDDAGGTKSYHSGGTEDVSDSSSEADEPIETTEAERVRFNLKMLPAIL